VSAGYRRSCMADVLELSRNLRKADIAELEEGHGCSPTKALLEGYTYSAPCYTLVGTEGEIVGMFGVVPQDEIKGAIWMLASDHLENYSIKFLREAGKAITELNAKHPLLFNCVDARNELHIKWLKWCGFTFIKKHERYGMGGIPFYEFVRART